MELVEEGSSTSFGFPGAEMLPISDQSTRGHWATGSNAAIGPHRKGHTDSGIASRGIAPGGAYAGRLQRLECRVSTCRLDAG